LNADRQLKAHQAELTPTQLFAALLSA
jgi:hypothetical protein